MPKGTNNFRFSSRIGTDKEIPKGRSRTRDEANCCLPEHLLNSRIGLFLKVEEGKEDIPAISKILKDFYREIAKRLGSVTCYFLPTFSHFYP
ncbi:hypothetical protein [Methanosarcina sp.]|uniref:hypothetical protein n=1 Tax=Methanosarcina sp. TaxID=2213 RepID=UPI0026238C22|nr:hypothetical protein [Methanosarcina sp.]